MDAENYVIVEVEGERSRVIELLNQLASSNPEAWRIIRKCRRSTDYKGRGCYRVEPRDVVKAVDEQFKQQQT